MASRHQQHLEHLAHLAHQSHQTHIQGNPDNSNPQAFHEGYDPWGLRYTDDDPPNQGTPLGVHAVQTRPTVPDLTKPGQYRNPGASSGTDTANYWQADPNLQRISGAMTQMLGVGSGPTGFDTSSNSLLGGPGQGLGRAELSSLYTLGKGNLARQRREQSAGAAQSAAGRGTVGIPSSMLFGPAANAADRGALATADLDARMKGYDLGMQQYQQKAGVFSNLGSLANSEANRGLQTQQSDFDARQAEKKFREGQLSQAQQAMTDFVNSHAQELAAPPEGAKKGKVTLHNIQNMLYHLNDLYDQANYNVSQFAV